MSIHLVAASLRPAAFIPGTFARKTVTPRGVPAHSRAAAQMPGKSREDRLFIAADRLIELPISAVLPKRVGKAPRAPLCH